MARILKESEQEKKEREQIGKEDTWRREARRLYESDERWRKEAEGNRREERLGSIRIM